MSNIDVVWNDAAGRGDWQVTGQGRLSTGNLLVTAVWISLFTDRAEAPPDRRGWWCDSLDGVLIGSRLRDLRRTKIANRTLLISAAKDILAEALQWMIKGGIVASVDIAVAATPSGPNSSGPNSSGTVLQFVIGLHQPGAAPTRISALWSAV